MNKIEKAFLVTVALSAALVAVGLFVFFGLHIGDCLGWWSCAQD